MDALYMKKWSFYNFSQFVYLFLAASYIRVCHIWLLFHLPDKFLSQVKDFIFEETFEPLTLNFSIKLHESNQEHLDYFRKVHTLMTNNIIILDITILNIALLLFVVQLSAKFSHITAVLRSLHWLPIKQRILI